MLGDTRLKIKLIKPLRGFAGRLYPRNSILEARIDSRNRVVALDGPLRLPLRPDAWELVLTDEDLKELLVDR